MNEICSHAVLFYEEEHIHLDFVITSATTTKVGTLKCVMNKDVSLSHSLETLTRE